MKNFIEQATKRLGKKRMRMVEEIHVDSEVYQVVLYTGYHNTSHAETMWTFGQHHLRENGGDQTVNEMFDDLISWFSNVEQVTAEEYASIYGEYDRAIHSDRTVRDTQT